MALSIRASIIDIRTDKPKNNDSFIVDSNVWLWLLYPPLTVDSNNNPKQQATNYPNYIKFALAEKANLLTSGLAYAELAHRIEATEKSIYDSRLQQELKPKDYRHNYPMERARIVQLINDAWSDILNYAHLLEVKLDADFMSKASSLLRFVGLDGYDVFLTQLAIDTGYTNIITDDADFATVQELTVFTANPMVINLARQSGKLIAR